MSEEETEKPQILIVDDYLPHEAVDGRGGWQQMQRLLQAVAEKLHPILDYVANRSDTRRTGIDTS